MVLRCRSPGIAALLLLHGLYPVLYTARSTLLRTLSIPLSTTRCTRVWSLNLLSCASAELVIQTTSQSISVLPWAWVFEQLTCRMQELVQALKSLYKATQSVVKRLRLTYCFLRLWLLNQQIWAPVCHQSALLDVGLARRWISWRRCRPQMAPT